MAIIKVDKESKIPLFGLDFIGILDRGTNLLEIKPITICNIKCKYCFVHAGDYENNFILDKDYIIYWLKKALEIKDPKENDIEIHIAPYGEFFAYKDDIELVREIKKLPQVKTISIQTNGTLLNEKKIKDLEKAGLTRLNISFNSLDNELAKYLSGCPNYNVDKLLEVFELVLQSKINLLIAPIWFFGINDEQIVKIIQLVKKYQNHGYSWDKCSLGIQNYLVYKTGRKLKKVRERDFNYFYKRLTLLEKEYDLKLKLGPNDFGIHRCTPLIPPVKIGEKVKTSIIAEGRVGHEFIGTINPMWAVKILNKSNFPLQPGIDITTTIIKKKKNENLITSII